MKILLIASLVTVIGASVAIAGPSGHGEENKDNGTQGHGSGGHAGMMETGMPGQASQVNRTIEVTMSETDDGEMIYTPKDFDIKKGETIRFSVTNKGELEHEFILDTMERNAMHKEAMSQQMESHKSPNAITLEPGEKGEIIWTFGNSGTFEVACLIPGHYESGMFGKVAVN
ncbi:plastocyanin/azurin family copper-binding protein [Ruegeria sp. PrR005]|uniref:Cupredoxin family protein n=1 Tax=Ruegeria sp. PrR005 TaxID=2706882 RepID=A0A6B2NQF6_9RHOB|nr:cupredoxin family protein [Ruegeria sp. PrR005]NDW44544.1 cupredoxin family protein [Ruegeria sp. PrR005]